MTDAQRDRRGLVALSLLVVANLVVGGLLVARYSSLSPDVQTTSNTPAGEASSQTSEAKATADSDPAPSRGETETPSETPKTETKIELRFPDGTYEVGGNEVKPGAKYVTVKPVKESCFVTILSKSGEFLVEKSVSSKDRASVTIPAKGSTFSSSGCGTWRRASGSAG